MYREDLNIDTNNVFARVLEVVGGAVYGVPTDRGVRSRFGSSTEGPVVEVEDTVGGRSSGGCQRRRVGSHAGGKGRTVTEGSTGLVARQGLEGSPPSKSGQKLLPDLQGALRVHRPVFAPEKDILKPLLEFQAERQEHPFDRTTVEVDPPSARPDLSKYKRREAQGVFGSEDRPLVPSRG